MAVSNTKRASGMFRILTPDGRPKGAIPGGLSDDDLKKIFRLMLATRKADDKALKLQRQGRMGTFAPSLGHEASQVGSAFALNKSDWFFPYFRDLGSFLTLDFPLFRYFLYWMGDERGMEIPEEMNMFPVAVPVGSQIPHAVGAGMAAGIKGERIAVLCTLGDGATSQGDFHEGLNFAGVFHTPTVFVCYNNQYAISMPRSSQTASETLAEKAAAYGFEGIQVDGNDVLAVHAATREALDKARSGGGPTFIEAFTYRMSNHTTSDDASRYRNPEEIQEWEEKDPLRRFRRFLENQGIWTREWEDGIAASIESDIDAAVKRAEGMPPPEPRDIFRFTYESMPPRLIEQLGDVEGGGREERP